MRDGTTENRYKVRHVPTGQFSTGGAWPSKSSKGKVWKMLHHLLSHIRIVSKKDSTWYSQCVVEEYEISITKVAEYPMKDMLDMAEAKKKERDALQQEAHRRYVEDRERKELARLKEKYE